jgi:hypothetical protein
MALGRGGALRDMLPEALASRMCGAAGPRLIPGLCYWLGEQDFNQRSNLVFVPVSFDALGNCIR